MFRHLEPYAALNLENWKFLPHSQVFRHRKHKHLILPYETVKGLVGEVGEGDIDYYLTNTAEETYGVLLINRYWENSAYVRW